MEVTAMRQLLSTTSVARLLGLSESRVRSLDHELEPERTDTGHRVYQMDRVRTYADRRAARRAQGT